MIEIYIRFFAASSSGKRKATNSEASSFDRRIAQKDWVMHQRRCQIVADPAFCPPSNITPTPTSSHLKKKKERVEGFQKEQVSLEYTKEDEPTQD